MKKERAISTFQSIRKREPDDHHFLPVISTSDPPFTYLKVVDMLVASEEATFSFLRAKKERWKKGDEKDEFSFKLQVQS